MESSDFVKFAYKNIILEAQNKILDDCLPNDTLMLMYLSKDKKAMKLLKEVDIVKRIIQRCVYTGQFHRAIRYLGLLRYLCVRYYRTNNICEVAEKAHNKLRIVF